MSLAEQFNVPTLIVITHENAIGLPIAEVSPGQLRQHHGRPKTGAGRCCRWLIHPLATHTTRPTIGPIRPLTAPTPNLVDQRFYLKSEVQCRGYAVFFLSHHAFRQQRVDERHRVVVWKETL
jgi:hypothetical protein